MLRGAEVNTVTYILNTNNIFSFLLHLKNLQFLLNKMVYVNWIRKLQMMMKWLEVPLHPRQLHQNHMRLVLVQGYTVNIQLQEKCINKQLYKGQQIHTNHLKSCKTHQMKFWMIFQKSYVQQKQPILLKQCKKEHNVFFF